MIRGIHYFSAELKTKIDVIPRSCFTFSYLNFHPLEVVSRYRDPQLQAGEKYLHSFLTGYKSYEAPEATFALLLFFLTQYKKMR